MEGRINCSTTIEADWTATKSTPPAQAAAAAPVVVSWCGQNVNCRDLLLQLLIFGLVNGAILALNAIGVTVIYSTVRTINLAHGDVFALTTAFVTSVINIIGLNLDWPASSRVLILAGVLLERGPVWSIAQSWVWKNWLSVRFRAGRSWRR